MSPRHRGTTRGHRIDYAQSAVEHLRHLGAGARAAVVDAVDERLAFEPTKETRNRNRMEENPLSAHFELRVGALRVYYMVDASARVVNVLAVGRKDRGRVIIGAEEIEL
ncbi:MAG TPA: type II toxin-antitoxin system RelE/ParE family toxin [Vicinamibacteria bacterium]|nr:type II toxin-antitoxin system RelE/ParE family toxin [Vicinamibacteria bacterium]